MSVLVLTAICLLVAASASAGPSPQSGTSRCSLPKSPGECTEALPINRFYYDRSSRQCKPFAFTGCGGNTNNFRTVEECRTACAGRTRRSDEVAKLDTPVVPTSAPIPIPIATAAVNCQNVNCPNDDYLANFYTELGCRPKFSPDDRCCATSYDCSSRKKMLDDKCYHDDHEYAVGAEVPAEQQPKCSVHCKCQKSEYDTYPRLNCVHIDCAEIFHGAPLPGCKRTYKSGTCCATGTVCGPPTNTTASTPETCTFEGKRYMEGEKFYSEKQPCQTCYCKRGSDGTLKAECERANCYLQHNGGKYLRQNCLPVFYKGSCCPVNYICENGTAPINVNPVATLPATVDAPEKCEFGAQHFTKGQTLPASFGGDCVTCKCLLPPYITCIKDQETCTATTPTTA